MLLDYANNGDPDIVIWADEHGNEFDVEEVRWVDKGGTRETIVWQKRRALTIYIAHLTSYTNLLTRIEAEQDTEKPYEYVDFIIEQGSIVGPIVSGALGSFKEVTLTNYGEIQGGRTTGKGGDALTLTSYLVLDNQGVIKGAGGRGGNGGSGASSSYEDFTDTVYMYSYDGGQVQEDPNVYGVFRYDNGPTVAVGWYWNGGNVYEQPANTEAWLEIPRNGNIQYLRSLSQISAGKGLEAHPIKKRTFFNVGVAAGIGGAGGYARGFNKGPTAGSAGTTKNGITGGRGGDGGDWGEAGQNGGYASDGGAAGRTDGYAAGLPIVGTEFIIEPSSTL